MHNVQTIDPFISIEVTVQLVRLAMSHDPFGGVFDVKIILIAVIN